MSFGFYVDMPVDEVVVEFPYGDFFYIKILLYYLGFIGSGVEHTFIGFLRVIDEVERA